MPSLHLPGCGLPVHHLPSRHFPVLMGLAETDFKALTLTIREICLMRAVEEITNKPDWWVKVKQPDVADKWRLEALAMDWAAYHRFADFTPAMADACIAELKHKADLYEKTGLVPILDYSAAVIKSDSIVPDGLWQSLRLAVAPLEQVPELDRDWHPGSRQTVLNLVHPSLWPLVYGRSRVLTDRRVGVDDALRSCGTGAVIPEPDEAPEGMAHCVSTRFQWLPCDVLVREDGRVKVESYINNLHPVKHAALYPVIEEFIEKSLPAWDVLYRWPDEFAMRRLSTERARVRCRAKQTCRKSHYPCTPKARPTRDDEPRRRKWEDGYSDSEISESDADDGDDEDGEDGEDDGDSEDGKGGKDDEDDEDGKDEQVVQPETAAKAHPRNRIKVLGHLGLKSRDESEYDTEPSADEDHQDNDVDASDDEQNGSDDSDSDVERNPNHISERDVKRRDFCWFNKTHPVVAPEPQKQCPVRLRADHVPTSDFFSFIPQQAEGLPPRTRRLQVIVKLASIHLTPEKPAYDGGSWHVEGQLNEHICSTALFYYDSQNVTESRLDFRTMANRDQLDEYPALAYEQYDWRTIRRLFAIESPGGGSTVQEIGSVLTRERRAVFFPNVFQHHVSPFRLDDPTREGHRKILALFLVDPAVRVISTANVPPQRRDWWLDQLDLGEGRLPPELADMVLRNVDDFPMGEPEARAYRAELMAERSANEWRAADKMRAVEWNFCEH
ncbi:uncharacterized protein UV8b_01722 [Ustilaginoidea virens]|uniref:Uncharacterized protein n=2 Tax=Ustilaginoidea virens TaxID=1159556 RepID=A0A8E5MFH0_USTVR|nr:uncharacterized protein UV8b_01722 [Ustilaginoidea virens]QUC17481.1 hypothetical protein UV8b_01722 [Ustilaginoidea virens]